MSNRKKLAYVLDDSVEFSHFLKVELANTGIEFKFFRESQPFLMAVKHEPPDFCFIDLNLNQVNEGIYVIKAMRSVLGSGMLIFALSAQAGDELILHSLETGANDYFIKPLDRTYFMNKLAMYLEERSDQGDRLGLYPVMNDYRSVDLEFDCSISHIDENGIYIDGNMLLSKGALLYLNSDLFLEFSGSATLGPLFVRSNSIQGASGTSYLEFYDPKPDLLIRLQRWIAEKNESSHA